MARSSGDRRSRARAASFLAAVALGAAALAPGTALAASPAPNREAAGADLVHVLVSFRAAPGADERRAIRAAGGTVRRAFRIVPALAAAVPEKAIAGLRRNPLVAGVELDARIRAFDHGPDTGDWEYENAWGVEHVGARAVHQAGIWGAGVKVAVIDTGIDYIHDDPDDSPYVVDPEFFSNYRGGYDFISNDTDPMDDNGHGTHVAGSLLAEKNGYLVSGVAPRADVYALKILDANGFGQYSGLIAALEWAVTNDMDLVNMSLGSHEPSATLDAAVEAAHGAGLLMVAAAGNVDPSSFEELMNGCPVAFPAAYPEVLSTTFTNENNALTGYSCTGPEVDFAAPGDNILSVVPVGPCMLCSDTGYAWLSGSSMASPHLAGTVALLVSAGITDPEGNGLLDDVRDQMCSAADLGYGVQTGFSSTPIPPSDPRYPKYFGCGVVDADGAVLSLAPPPPPNAAPVANDDSATTAEDTAVTVAVKANDTDADGDALDVTGVSGATNGTATLNPNDTVTFTPAANFNGAASVSYTLSDGKGGTDTGLVSVTVTPVADPPNATNDTATVAEDGSVIVTVLANDSDPDGDSLAVTGVGAAANGATVVNGNGTITYTPAANYSGADSFTYTVSDGTSTAGATVNVTVTAVNDVPLANAASATTPVGTSVQIVLSGSDVETCELTFEVGLPAHGGVGSVVPASCVSGNPRTDSQTVTYTPNSGYAGADSFTYRVWDGGAWSTPATVSITVTGTPPPPPPAPSVHAGDMDAAWTSQGKSWTARVTITAHTEGDAVLSGATVTGNWGGGASGSASCTTGTNGRCTISKGKLSTSLTSVTFTITNIGASGRTYLASANHDPDGDSTGTSITVSRV